MTRRRPRSRGQTLPLFAILAPLMLALMALGLDAAQLFLERRDAQGAADLAALAGVVHLPGDAPGARSAALANGSANGYPVSEISPVTPYAGDARRIEVTIHSKVDTFFLSVLDVLVPGDYATIDVSARAVARAEPGAVNEGDYVLYALQPCGSEKDFEGITWPGNENIIEGSVHSDSGIYISGNTMSYDDRSNPAVDEFRTAFDTYQPGIPLHQWSLEGWMAGKSFVEALNTMGAAPTRQGLEDWLRGLKKYTANGLSIPIDFQVIDSPTIYAQELEQNTGLEQADCTAIAQWQDSVDGWVQRTPPGGECFNGTWRYPTKASDRGD